METSPTRNSKYSGVVESERKRSRATMRRHTAYGKRDPGPRTHLALSIHSLFPLGRPLRSAPRPGESASLCVAIIYSIRARKTAPRSHRVINRGELTATSVASQHSTLYVPRRMGLPCACGILKKECLKNLVKSYKKNN